MVIDPLKRLTIEQIMHHPYWNNVNVPSLYVDAEIRQFLPWIRTPAAVPEIRNVDPADVAPEEAAPNDDDNVSIAFADLKLGPVSPAKPKRPWLSRPSDKKIRVAIVNAIGGSVSSLKSSLGLGADECLKLLVKARHFVDYLKLNPSQICSHTTGHVHPFESCQAGVIVICRKVVDCFNTFTGVARNQEEVLEYLRIAFLTMDHWVDSVDMPAKGQCVKRGKHKYGFLIRIYTKAYVVL